MIVAVVIGHMPVLWCSSDQPTTLRNNLFVIIAALALVFLGVARLPGSWSR